MLVADMKKMLDDAVSLANSADELAEDGDTDTASISAQISIAKSLAVIAGILEKATNGQASINTYDMSHPEI